VSIRTREAILSAGTGTFPAPEIFDRFLPPGDAVARRVRYISINRTGNQESGPLGSGEGRRGFLLERLDS
jgi:hypothetical protein